MINYRVGNLFDDIGTYQMPYVLHIVNDIFRMGAGFVVPLGHRYPQNKKNYLALRHQFRIIPQGYALISKEIDATILNCVAQVGIYSKNNQVPFRVESLELALIEVKEYLTANDQNATILMPRIGCGLSKGRWADIEPIIKKYLDSFNVIVYTLPHEVHLFQ